VCFWIVAGHIVLVYELMSKAAVWAYPYAVTRVIELVAAVKAVADIPARYFCVVANA